MDIVKVLESLVQFVTSLVTLGKVDPDDVEEAANNLIDTVAREFKLWQAEARNYRSIARDANTRCVELQKQLDAAQAELAQSVSANTVEADRAERRRAVRNAFTELLYGIRTDRKITAIKAVRSATDWGLKDAKDYTENLIDALKPRA